MAVDCDQTLRWKTLCWVAMLAKKKVVDVECLRLVGLILVQSGRDVATTHCVGNSQTSPLSLITLFSRSP